MKRKCFTTKYAQNFLTGQTVFWYLIQIIWNKYQSSILDGFTLNLFNNLGADTKFVFTPSLQNYPDLLPWIHYKFNNKNRHGYLYGTPPANLLERQILVKNKNKYFNLYILVKQHIHGDYFSRDTRNVHNYLYFNFSLCYRNHHNLLIWPHA